MLIQSGLPSPRSLSSFKPTPCSATLLVSFPLNNATDNAIFAVRLLTVPVSIPSLIVSGPRSGNDVALSSTLGLQILNRGNSTESVLIDTSLVTAAVASTLGIPSTAVISVGGVQGTISPLPPAPPPPNLRSGSPSSSCGSPKLGSLCGSDAAGAIAGIAVGGFVLLLLLGYMVWHYCINRKSTVFDEYHWSEKYSYVMNPAYQIAHMAAGQKKGSQYVRGYKDQIDIY